MVELHGQFAVRDGIVDICSPEAPRPVRIELLGDTVESVREFDARTQRSVAPVVRTTILPLTEWAVPAEATASWDLPSYWGPKEDAAQHSLLELASSALKPIVFLDESASIFESVRQFLADATETYERHGHTNSPTADHFFWHEENLQTALAGASQIQMEELALNAAAANSFSLSSRPSSRFHGDVVACVGAIKSQLAAGGTVYLSTPITREIEGLSDFSSEFKTPLLLCHPKHPLSEFTPQS